MVKQFVYKYHEGFADRRCMVMAEDETKARELFFKAHPKLRPYNLDSVTETSRLIFELAG